MNAPSHGGGLDFPHPEAAIMFIFTFFSLSLSLSSEKGKGLARESWEGFLLVFGVNDG